MRFRVNIQRRNLFDGLSAPMNPYLSIIGAILNIVYGGFLLLPWTRSPKAAAPYLEYVFPDGLWAWPLLFLGIAMLLTLVFWNALSMSNFMAANGILWSIMTGLLMVGEWTSGTWILYLVIAIYSLMTSANLKVNFADYDWRKKIS